jgi:hypothetical protein
MISKSYFSVSLLILVLILAACTPAAQPVATATAIGGELSDPSATPTIAAAPSITSYPSQEAEVIVEPETNGCPVTNGPRYVNNLYGYCFAYPEGFAVQVQTPQGPALVGPALDDSSDPVRVSLTISARPVPESAELGGLVTGFLGQSSIRDIPEPLERTGIQAGGEPAEMLEPVPGRLSSRVVSILHGATFYQLYFTPMDLPEAEAGLQNLYETVLTSLAFFPVAPQTPAGPETANFYEFERIFSFTYDPILALLVEAQTVEAVPVSPEVMFAESHPTFAQFSFLGYDGGRLFQLPYPFQTPRLMVFPTQDFPAFDEESTIGFSRQFQDLRSLLEVQTDLAGRCTHTAPVSGELALPFLPWLNSAQVFCAQPQYIAFAGGKGIRYLTAFSQGIEPLMDPSIFYTFQGLSEDSQFYFSAVFPVLTGVFPLEIPPMVEGQLPQSMNAEQLSALNAQAGDLFHPALGKFDALVSSLEVKN